VRLVAALTFALSLGSACSGGGAGAGGGLAGDGGATTFTPATRPLDVCSLLSVSDAATLVPGDLLSAPTPPNLGASYWSVGCDWTPSLHDPTAPDLELLVYGANTVDGLGTIKLAVQQGTKTTPVNGIGDEAHYWEQDTSANGIWALSGSYAVDLSAVSEQPFPTPDQLAPVVSKVIGELK
jgi:hypothetical protein